MFSYLAMQQMPLVIPLKTLNRGPHVTVAGFVYDATGHMVMLHRSAQVRSAKNAWSFPSGLHEERLTLEEQLGIELQEELGLEPTGRYAQIGTYENIAIEDGWHWVITMFNVRVVSLATVVNKEPHKHDEIRSVSIAGFNADDYVWTPGLKKFLESYWEKAKADMLIDLEGHLCSVPAAPCCADWAPQTELINGPIILQSIRSGGLYQYAGKPFVFCPWCGKHIVRMAP